MRLAQRFRSNALTDSRTPVTLVTQYPHEVHPAAPGFHPESNSGLQPQSER